MISWQTFCIENLIEYLRSAVRVVRKLSRESRIKYPRQLPCQTLITKVQLFENFFVAFVTHRDALIRSSVKYFRNLRHVTRRKSAWIVWSHCIRSSYRLKSFSPQFSQSKLDEGRICMYIRLSADSTVIKRYSNIDLSRWNEVVSWMQNYTPIRMVVPHCQ